MTWVQTQYKVVPHLFTCTGPTFQKFIIVNPKPNISSPVNVTVCSGTPFKTTPATGGSNIVPSSTQYTWTMPQYSDTSLSGGSGLQQSPTIRIWIPPLVRPWSTNPICLRLLPIMYLPKQAIVVLLLLT